MTERVVALDDETYRLEFSLIGLTLTPLRHIFGYSCMNHVVLACEAAIGHLGLRRRARSKKILSLESKSLQIWHFLKCSEWSIVVPEL
jgi:hypothetical protein